MASLYRYVLVNDGGMAPCLDDDQLTLALCKPKLRRRVTEGDWVAGFCPTSMKIGAVQPPGRLAYIARVSKKLSVAEYERQHPLRSDAIYRLKANGTFHRKRPSYHDDPESIRRDLSADVLIFDHAKTWYFGGTAIQLSDEFEAFYGQGRGHRVTRDADRAIERLLVWLRNRHAPGFHGEPRHGWQIAPEGSGSCTKDCSSAELRRAAGGCG